MDWVGWFVSWRSFCMDWNSLQSNGINGLIPTFFGLVTSDVSMTVVFMLEALMMAYMSKMVVTTNPWVWRSLVLKVSLMGESIHGGQAAGLVGVAMVQDTRIC